jgi:hypothetical protein
VNTHALGPWPELLKDFLIPVLAILIPTIIAVVLANRERRAATATRVEDRRLDLLAREEDRRLAREAREDDRRLAEQESREHRRQEGGAAALEAMEQLTHAAEERDDEERKDRLTNMRTLLFKVTLKLQAHHPTVSDWVVEELKVVTRAASDRGEDGRALRLRQIQARYAEFSIRMTSWLLDQTDDSWFKDRPSPPVETADVTRSSE